MDISVIVIMVIIVIVVGYILSRPFLGSNLSPEIPSEIEESSNPSANTLLKNELLEPTTPTDELPEDDTLPDK
jgi:hypothetical protein